MAVNQRRQSLLLLVKGRQAALITDGDRLENVAVVVDLERQGMADARIGGITFVVIVEGFARMAEKDGVAIRPLGLKAGQLVTALGNAVWQV
jgi:hypothetical protein